MKNIYTFENQNQVFSPALIYYKDIITENIKKTIFQAGGAEFLFPHVKTHKMEEMVRLQMEFGINKFKCATFAEAEMTALCGAKKIILAYPLVGPSIERFIKLVEKFPNSEFFAIADSSFQVSLLGKTLKNINLLMDVDMGQHRTGVALDCVENLYEQWSKIKGINLCGLHCYDGHIHQEDFQKRNCEVFQNNLIIKKIVKNLTLKNLNCSLVVAGGTPSFPCHKSFDFDFYYSPGTCIVQDCGYAENYKDIDQIPAATILGRVISRPSPSTFTIDIGVKAIASDPKGERGLIVGMEYAKTVIQNEEHWVLAVPHEKINQIPEIGEVVFAIPTHICPSTALYPSAIVIENSKITGNWEVTARNRILTI